MFSMVMMCRTDDGDGFLGGNDDQLTSLEDLVDYITDISTLKEKPKLITIQVYTGKNFSITHFYYPRIAQGARR